eukprot:339223-Hanusia_phi.AAC.1
MLQGIPRIRTLPPQFIKAAFSQNEFEAVRAFAGPSLCRTSPSLSPAHFSSRNRGWFAQAPWARRDLHTVKESCGDCEEIVSAGKEHCWRFPHT